MTAQDLVIHIFCLIDDQLKALNLPRLRQRGPQPALHDAEVLAIVAAGELLGLDQDKAIFRFFGEHFGHLFPALRRIHRGSFVRQAANLWRLSRLIQEHLAEDLLADRGGASWWILDSFPLPLCRFARARRCRRLADIAACGYDGTIQAVFYGLRVHLRVAHHGLIMQCQLAPANQHDAELADELLPADGLPALGDRNDWVPPLQAQLAQEGKRLIAPFHLQSRDRRPELSKLISRMRQVIEPVIGQLAERLHAKRTWAKDRWHLGARLNRKILAHTAAVCLNIRLGHPPLRLELLLNP